MHDLPSMLLLQQSHASPKSGEDLEVLGKYAAEQFAKRRCASLSDAVVAAVKEAGLSPEQVRRVVEFANTNAFLAEHKKEGAVNRYVDFVGGPADPAEVLRDLNDGGGGTVFDRGVADYSLPPLQKVAGASLRAMEKVAAEDLGPTLGDLAGDMGEDIASQRGTPEYRGFDPFGDHQKRRQVAALMALGHAPVKVASIPFLMEEDPGERLLLDAFHVEEEPMHFSNPLTPGFEMRDKLAGAVDHLTSELSGRELDCQYCTEELYKHVKEAAASGVPLGHVLVAWQNVVPDESYVKIAFAYLSPRLVDEGVFDSFNAVGASLEKTAHVGLVNTSHPLVTAMVDYCSALEKVAQVREAREMLLVERNRMTDFLSKTGSVLGSAAGAAKKFVRNVADSGGVVPKVTDAFRTAGNAAGGATQGAGEFLFGTGSQGARRTGEAVRKAVTYTPHAAAVTGGVLGAQEMREKARYSPAFQTTKNFVMSRIPYTHQNLVAQHQAAMEGMY